jgi:prepilin-type N-terminal cleavage/methylation domain-containing protein
MGKVFLWKFAKSKRGVSLVEVLVSLAILAIAAAPFLSSFLTAAGNNRSAEDLLEASSYAQKAMELIKSNSIYLLDENGDLTGGGSFVPLRAFDSGSYRVEYRITGISSDSFTPSTGYDFGGVDSYNISFTVDFPEGPGNTDVLVFEGREYRLESEDFALEVSGSKGSYSYRLDYSGLPGVEHSGSIAAGEGRINIGIIFKKIPSSDLRLSVDLKNLEDREVDLYIVGTGAVGDRINIYGKGGSAFNMYYNISSQPVIYDSSLYRIDVVVRKDGETRYTLTSYVKK